MSSYPGSDAADALPPAPSREPADLAGLSTEELGRLATEIRDFLVAKGLPAPAVHLGPKPGRGRGLHPGTAPVVFEINPPTASLFDTGHQFLRPQDRHGSGSRLPSTSCAKRRAGLTGYPSQAESEHEPDRELRTPPPRLS